MKKKNTLSLAFSPCPNDTFIFDALVNGRINKPFNLTYEFLDIEKLNQAALRGKYDIIKISIPLYSRICKEYQLLTAGSALGKNNGPLLVAGNKFDLSELCDKIVAVPGKNTTANFLLDLFFPHSKKKRFILFSEIIESVRDGMADAGLLIHETRFTYKSKGLMCLADFGKLWREKTGLMLPLGAIAVRRKLPEKLKFEINNKIAKSVIYGLKNPKLSWKFVQENAAEMNPVVQQKHINLYVNEYSVNMGNTGKRAIYTLLNLFIKEKKIKPLDYNQIWIGYTHTE